MQNAFTEKGLNRVCVWESFGAFFQKKEKKKKKKSALFSWKLPLLANIEPCPKFLEYAQ